MEKGFFDSFIEKLQKQSFTVVLLIGIVGYLAWDHSRRDEAMAAQIVTMSVTIESLRNSMQQMHDDQNNCQRDLQKVMFILDKIIDEPSREKRKTIVKELQLLTV